MLMTGIYLKYKGLAYEKQPQMTFNDVQKRDKTFLNFLPTSFNRQGYLKVAKELMIPDNTAQKYIRKLVRVGVIQKQVHDSYKKTET